jgi:hypothetical protein
VPWDRLLPEALTHVRRHRGHLLAQRLEESVNEALIPAATLAGEIVRGSVEPSRGEAALLALAAGLGRVAGGAFAHRLLVRLARDLACEDAVTKILASEPPL